MSEKVEDWKAITPETLLAPVEHVRETFDEGVWKCSRVTEQLCFADLHADDPQVDLVAFRSAFVTYRGIIGPQPARQFDSYHQIGTPAAIFYAYLEAFSAGLESNILGSFDDLLKMGIAHSPKLSTRPVEWAKAHLSILINDNKHIVTLWIKSVCDRQDYSRPLNTEQETDDFIHWRYWRAPRLILMQPSGNLPFNASTAWHREDESATKKLLEGLSSRFNQSLGFHLDKVAGNAYVELAKTRVPQGNDDRPFQLMAIEEARRSAAEDERPHPRVGAVVVKDGQVLSKAHRGENPKSHAEYVALDQKLSDELAAGATVYTTLEPCTTRNHPKIPCAQRIVDRKVDRVVIGMLDPNPDIRGLGVQLLNDAGIETQLFPRDLAAQVEEINREWIRLQKEKQTRSKTNEGDRASMIAARSLTDATWDLQRAAWALYTLHTQHGVARAVRDIVSKEEQIQKDIDAAVKVFAQDYDLAADLSAVAKGELEKINIALVNLMAFSIKRQESDMEIAATQVQDACERVRLAARPYAYRPSV